MPDLGNDLHAKGVRSDTLLEFLNIQPRQIVDYGDFREFTFRLATDEGAFLGTLQTTQSIDELLENLEAGWPLVSAKLAPETVTGTAGEVFRLLLGKVGSL
jgi:hypothetical protein